MNETPSVPRTPYVAVIGDGDPRGPDAHRILEWAEEVGHELARGGAVVITGGLGGVMRAASRGALAGGGETIGILPGSDRSEANEYVRTAIATGLGVARNIVVVTAADAVVAIGGRHGTLSEIGMALRQGRHVVALSSWRIESDQRMGGTRIHRAQDPQSAAAVALRLARGGPSPTARWLSENASPRDELVRGNPLVGPSPKAAARRALTPTRSTSGPHHGRR